MDTSRVVPILCLALFLGAGIPAAVYMALRRDRGGVGQVELLQRAAHRARNPWSDEDENLKELSQRVAAYKEKPGEDKKQEDKPRQPTSGGKHQDG